MSEHSGQGFENIRPRKFPDIMGSGIFQNDMFEYQPYPPTQDPDVLLGNIVVRGIDDSLLDRRLSQTPLLPEKLIDRGIEYPQAVWGLLEERVGDAVVHAGLKVTDYYAQAVMYEVHKEHERRIKGNTDAARGLYSAVHGEELTHTEAVFIWKARTGDATIGDTAELLMRYPLMNSIEAAKYTQPFDWEEMKKVDTIYLRENIGQLVARASRDPSKQFSYYPEADLRREPRYVPTLEQEADQYIRDRQSLVVVLKDNVAEFTSPDTMLQLVRKQAMIMLPPNLKLSDQVIPLVRKGPHGEIANLQPISLSYYWRVQKPKESPVLVEK